MFTRRTATVTTSAPEASCAACMIWCDGYLPVPMSSREVNSRPAINKVSMIDSRLPDSPADEVHDFDLIAFGDGRVRIAVTLEDDEIVLDGDTTRIDLQRDEQLGDRGCALE